MDKKVLLSPPTKKYLKKLKDKKLQKLFLEKIEEIAEYPYEVGHLKTGDLVGVYGVDVRYVGVNYEIAYSI